MTEIEEFKRMIVTISRDIEKFKRDIKKTNLSPRKINLLQGFASYRKGERNLIFDVTRSQFENDFFEGFRRYLLGITHNHFGNYAFAKEHLIAAHKHFLKHKETDYIVFTLTALILSLANSRDVKSVKIYQDKLLKYSPSSEHSYFLIQHAHAVAYQMLGEDEKLNDLLNEIFSKNREKFEYFKPSFLLVSFIQAFRRDDYDQCYEVLRNYKKSKGHSIQANYRYMKILLDHLAFSKPLYIYERFFVDFSELRDQLAVVKYLSRQEFEIAEKFWSKLCLHNPNLYRENFYYHGDDCLFSRVLNMYNKTTVKPFCDKTLETLKGPMQKLEHIIKNTNHHAFSKELLIKLIWNELPDERNQSRLRKLIYEFKKNNPTTTLESRQNTYVVKIA